MEVQSTPRSAETISDSNDELLETLSLENAQLRHALHSRIVIEQAKGSISARSNVPVDVAFEMLRAVARNRRQKITSVAAEVIANGGRLNAVPVGIPYLRLQEVENSPASLSDVPAPDVQWGLIDRPDG